MRKVICGVSLLAVALVACLMLAPSGSAGSLSDRQMSEIKGRLPIGCPCSTETDPISCGDRVYCDTCKRSFIYPPVPCPTTEYTYTNLTYKQCVASTISPLSCDLSSYVLCRQTMTCADMGVWTNKTCWMSPDCSDQDGEYCRECESGSPVHDSEKYEQDQICW